MTSVPSVAMGKPKYVEENCPETASSNTNHTYTAGYGTNGALKEASRASRLMTACFRTVVLRSHKRHMSPGT
jgi:hypothetical protein